MADMTRSLTACFLLGISTAACAKPAPPSIEELQSKEFDTSLEFVRDLEPGPDFTAYLVAYRSAGLRVFAMVAVPETPPRAGGYPVLVANHGHHPDPPRYGITADGVDSRPGDYYRDIPALYTAHGFLVVMPDYRGHNTSEGIEFTDGLLESAYYTEDVLALLAGIDDLEHADADNIFMWGHSMGAEVTLRALLATKRVRGAALWSSVGGEIWDQAYYYSRYRDRLAPDASNVPKASIDDLRAQIAEFGGDYAWQDREPLFYLDSLIAPIIIQHSIGDKGALYVWSERLAKALYLRRHPYRFHGYSGDDHFFAPQLRHRAADRDAAFFRSLMSSGDAAVQPGGD